MKHSSAQPRAATLNVAYAVVCVQRGSCYVSVFICSQLYIFLTMSEYYIMSENYNTLELVSRVCPTGKLELKGFSLLLFVGWMLHWSWLSTSFCIRRHQICFLEDLAISQTEEVYGVRPGIIFSHSFLFSASSFFFFHLKFSADHFLSPLGSG